MDEIDKSIIILIISIITTLLVIFLGLLSGIITITKEEKEIERKNYIYYENVQSFKRIR